MDAATLRERVTAALQSSRDRIRAFKSPAGRPDFSATIHELDRLVAPLNGLQQRVGLYVHVHPDPDVRASCEELEQELAALHTELSLDRAVFERLVSLDAQDAADPAEARLHEKVVRDFRRSGVDRDEATREKIRALQEELVQIGQEFDRNIVTGGRDYVVKDGHAGLAGLPRDFLAAHPEREDGTVVLSTDPADRLPMLSYAERDDVRREYFLASTNRAAPENLEVLPRLLAKRHELAQLLGYDHWADYVTEDKMSGSAAEARAFVERLLELVASRAAAECAELIETKRAADPGAEPRLFEWQRLYLTERVKADRHGFDSQSVRPYFAYRRVKDGILATSAALYGIEFRRNEEVETWHPSVECHDIVDGGETVARFYLDMHPRDGKFKHAAMFDLCAGVEQGPLPEAVLVCNFPEPTGDDPGLLLHDQVTTFFHEFGHLLHHLFAGRQRFLAFSGIATEHDFAEVPSQMYEEWAWNAGVLREFARHHETGEPIPEELVARMRTAEEYGKAMHVQTQLFYALLSLTYYDRDPAGLDAERTMIELKERLLPTPHTPGNRFCASFGHLHGYSAMYYTYMWSLVIAKDLFSRFESNLMDGATANAYRLAVLAPGGSQDAKELVKGFLGREYGFDAFRKWLGG